MTPFYNTEDRILALRFHAVELVGTPYAPHAMVPGAGIDCIHVNVWVYLKTHFLSIFTPPKYSLDSGSHSHKSQLLAWLDGCNQFEKVSGPAVAGDTICFNIGISEHHVGLMLDDKRFIHILFFGAKKVIISDLEKEHYYRRRVTSIYRPMETTKGGV